MNFRKYVSELANASDEVRFYRLVIAGLIILLILISFGWGKSIGRDRTIVVPPEVKKSFWVDSEGVSEEYLEEMAYWYVGQALNVSLHTADYQHQMFLKFVAPSEAARLTSELKGKADYLKKNNLASMFSVRAINPDRKKMRVALTGVVTSWMGDKKLPDRNATYMVGFQYLNGKLYVSDFKETSEQAPFDVSTSPRS